MTYCSVTDVENVLQRDPTSAELTLLPGLVATASEWIDQYTGRSYAPQSLINETQRIYGPLIYLRQKPVASIQAVRMRLPYAGAATWALTSPTGYELLDPAAGRMTVGWQIQFPSDIQDTSWYNYLLEVDYTVSAAVPARVTQAAAMLAAHWLQTPDNDRYDRISVDGLTLSRRAYTTPVPPEILAFLPRKLVWA